MTGMMKGFRSPGGRREAEEVADVEFVGFAGFGTRCAAALFARQESVPETSIAQAENDAPVTGSRI